MSARRAAIVPVHAKGFCSSTGLTVAFMTDIVPSVQFIIFNCPDTAAKVFESIRSARPPLLHIANGARNGQERKCT